MTHPQQDDRRSFASRTPANDNPEKVVYRRGFVTRHQVTGWRFVMRRIASGVALHGTRIGIPGAPQRLVQSTRKDADWTVCDAASGTAASRGDDAGRDAARGGAAPSGGVTVIAGAPDSSGSRAAALDTGKAILVSN